jgi:dTDP-4-dehydrorhamnose reductase
MRILVLGGDGMLGHQLLKQWSGRHEVGVTVRSELKTYRPHGLFTEANTYALVDVRFMERILEVLAEFRPDAVINAVGLVKQRPDAKEAIPSIEINSLLPHRLALMCNAIGARLVHLSTDCVFSGRRGNYSEMDTPDPEDVYGRSKLIGEVSNPGCITLRTSIIGRELARNTSLIEWFLAQSGAVKGFTKAIYTGFSTIEMARIIEMVLLHHKDLSGIYNVSSEPIDKYRLLGLVKHYFKLDTEILPDDSFACDRSLNSARFREITGYVAPAWKQMIEEMATDFHGETK